jgi:hypothetical protein
MALRGMRINVRLATQCRCAPVNSNVEWPLSAHVFCDMDVCWGSFAAGGQNKQAGHRASE